MIGFRVSGSYGAIRGYVRLSKAISGSIRFSRLSNLGINGLILELNTSFNSGPKVQGFQCFGCLLQLGV